MAMRAEHTPQVSVIIPVYNGERFLAEAIRSVLAQTYALYELIVVDDGSTDRTPEIAQSFPAVRYVRQMHAGAAAARKRGVEQANGEYLAFLDADDLWMPDKLSVQMRAFEEDLGLEAVSGLVEQFEQPGLERRYSIPLVPQPGYSLIALVVTRQVLGEVGGFPEEPMAGETIAWFTQFIAARRRFRIVQHVVARRRIHGQNFSLINQEEKTHNMLRGLKRSIDSKRAAQASPGREKA
jgi:glycosyltransferase involved in cell wall biosynthesis